MKPGPNRRRILAGWILLPLFLIALCAGTAYWTARWSRNTPEQAPTHLGGHAWLHRELDLTDAQIESLEKLEITYHADREPLLEEFDRRIQHLAGLLRTEAGLTPEVEEAIHQVHEVHGRLQELSIVHFFDMVEVLPVEKRDPLRSLAAQALSEPE
ncbi:MAG: periplasmic heavy metal sensor [Kiritimatiellae bacterium]|jgi:hypothetical protein|nr:periplasmic heavy metal sensor [Kiritimatiellia bacterium]